MDRHRKRPRSATAAFALLLTAVAGLAPLAGESRAQAPAGTVALAEREPMVEIRFDSAIDAARIRSTVDIPVPPELVWQLMLDCEHSKRVVPGMESCRVLQRDPGGRWDIREHVVSWAWFMPRVRNVFRSEYAPPHRLTFRRIDGDLRLSSGEWRLEPLSGGRATRVHYNSTVSADVPAPQFIVVEALRRDLTTVMKNLRRECIAAHRGRAP